MKSEIITSCDICGTTKNYQWYWQIGVRHFLVFIKRRKFSIIPYKQCDICVACQNKVNDFINTMKIEKGTK